MITQFRIENFKGHRDTNLALHQLTLLVGDNGSGKTSVLEALRFPAEIPEPAGALELDEMLRRTAKQNRALSELVHQGMNHMRLSSDGETHGQRWTASIGITAPDDILTTAPEYQNWQLTAGGVDASGSFNEVHPGVQLGWYSTALQRIMKLLGRIELYRFRSDQIAAGAYSDQPGASVAEDGAQTAVVLAELKLADDEAFNRIESAMCKVVPSLRRIRLRPTEVTHRSNPNPVVGTKLYFDFQGAKNVPAHHASQGTLVVLALLTVLYGHYRPDLILRDDFDHALHPRAQMELVRMIKELLTLDDFRETQIVATTHSPYVLDEVAPSNVIAFALNDNGTVISRPLSEHPDAPKVNGSLKAGELWSLDPERSWVR